MIIVDACYPGLARFIASIEQECVVLFDEFDKIFRMTDDKDDLGYNYPEAECRKYTNKYLYHDVQGTEIRELPEWFGAGFYQAYIDEHRIVNSDTGALGTTNVTRYRIGLDYYQAIKNLPAVE